MKSKIGNKLQHTAIAVSVLVLLQGCGRNDEQSIPVNQSPTAKITGGLLFDERSVSELSGETSTDADGSVASYAWDFNLGDYSGDRIHFISNGSSATIEAGELADDVTMTITLTVTGIDGTSSSSTANVRVEEIDRNRLPPMPTNGDNTLLGVDSDNDGVRDDIEIAILDRYPLSIINREVSRRATEIYTEVLNAGEVGDDTVVSAASERMAVLVACYFSQTDMNVQKESGLLEALILNTTERIQAYEKFDAKLSGKVQRTVDADPATCRLPQNVGP